MVKPSATARFDRVAAKVLLLETDFAGDMVFGYEVTGVLMSIVYFIHFFISLGN